MAASEFIEGAHPNAIWCDQLLKLAETSDVRSGWKDHQAESCDEADRRPLSRVVRFSRGCRVYQGWRAESIAETLDLCSATKGSLWITKRVTVDEAGKVYLGHVEKDGAHRLWRQNNLAAAKENSKLQAAKSRARFREQWEEYRAAYRQRFPDSVPVGFDRWCRVGRKSWLEHGVAGLSKNLDQGHAAHQKEYWDEAYKKHAEKEARALARRGQTGTH